MKKNVIFIACMILSILVFGQNETKNQLVNEKTTPEFVGIYNDSPQQIDNYLSKNIVCPRETAECRKEGTEVVRFTVTPSGELTDFKVINSVCPKMDEELIRVLKTTNRMWKPGFNNGVPTKMEHEVAILVGNCKENEIVSHFVQQAEKYFALGNITLFEELNPKKALKFYNKGALYLPNDPSVLTLRGLCYYELGDTENAKKDWTKVKIGGGVIPVDLTSSLTIENDISEMKGYSEMKELMAKNKEN